MIVMKDSARHDKVTPLEIEHDEGTSPVNDHLGSVARCKTSANSYPTVNIECFEEWVSDTAITDNEVPADKYRACKVQCNNEVQGDKQNGNAMMGISRGYLAVRYNYILCT